MYPAFPLLGPPTGAGIYLIRNSKTGHVYVGKTLNLRRRYGEWRGVFGSGLGATNQALDAAVRQTSAADWEFCVFVEAPANKINDLESRAIAKTVERVGDKCLNCVTPHPIEEKPPAEMSMPLTTIYDVDGSKMTYSQAAVRRGVTQSAMKKRLAALRKKGKTELAIIELL